MNPETSAAVAPGYAFKLYRPRVLSFSKSSRRGAAQAEKALEGSDAKLAEVDDESIKMTDRFNNGTPVRAWLSALGEGGQR